MNIQNDRLLSLVRSSIHHEKLDPTLFANMQQKDWIELMYCAQQEGMLGVAFDAFEQSEVRPPIEELMEWFGKTSYMETIYDQHRESLTKLAKFFADHGIKMLLLKGYGLSLNYPTPNHRPTGDIDIYLCGDGGKADELMLSEFGITSKQNEEKHSVFEFEGITVENHACFINDTSHPSLHKLEVYFEKDAEYATPINQSANDASGFFVPSVSTNALYLPYHIADHFFHGEASLRQLCDWAFFVKKYYNHICWRSTEEWAKKSGFFKFFCCLNGIVQDYLGVDSSFFPNWPRDKKLENQVLNEILTKRQPVQVSLLRKVIRYFSSSWKFRLVYNENIFLASLRQARAYALVKYNKGGKGIWEK